MAVDRSGEMISRFGLVLAVLVLLGAGVQAASVQEALIPFREGYYELAAREFKAVLAAEPDNIEAIYWLARCEIATGDFIGAENHLREILASKPESVESRYWLGEALAAQWREEEAISVFNAVLKHESGHTASRQALARLKSLPANVERFEHGGRSGFSASALSLDGTSAELLSSNVYDYTFSKAPTDWLIRSGEWNATSRWTCSPQWSWYGGYSREGIAAMWNKREFVGDIVVEMYIGFKMRLNRSPTYLPPNDMNITICGDGANPDSGYSFIIGGNDNRVTRIMRGTKMLTQTSEPAALWPITENGQPPTYEWHRKWWGIRVRKSGSALQLYLDNKLVLQAKDEDPLESGRVGIWVLRNDIITPRIKIYYEDEKQVRNPLPDDAAPAERAVEVRPANLRLTSQSHSSLQNDFENGVSPFRTRDGDQGAELSIVAAGKDGGHCLRLVNPAAGGSFGATLRRQQFDVAELSKLAFDYRITQESKVNFYLTCSGQSYEIVFTGPTKPASGCILLGHIPEVQTDGQWHHAEFDLLGHLRALMPEKKSLRCSDLWAGNASNEGYLLAGFGGNRITATWYMDNFFLGQPHGAQLKLAITPTKSGIKGYAVSVDKDPHGQPPEKVATQDKVLSLQLEGEGIWYAHIKPLLADGQWGPTVNYRAAVDAQPPVVKSVEPPPGTAIGDSVIRIALKDPGGSGIDLGKLSVRFNDQQLSLASDGVSWDPASSILQLDPAGAGISLENGQSAAIELASLSDRAGNTAKLQQFTFAVDYKHDQTPPTAPTINITEAYLIDDTFEKDLGGWERYGDSEGVKLSRDDTTAADGRYSLKVYNSTHGGRFGAYVTRQRFEAGKHRIVSFDYKLDDRIRTDFAVYVNGNLQGIKFTDNDNNVGVIGQVPNVRADNEWHHAEFDLYEMLKKADPEAGHYEVRQFLLADWGSTGNRVGAHYHIDNFRIIPVISGAEPISVSWASADISGIAGVSWAADNQASKLPSRELMEKDKTFKMTLPDLWRLWISLCAQDRAGNWSTVTRRPVLVDADRPVASIAAPAADSTTAVSETVLNLYDNGKADVDPNTVILEVAGHEYTIANAGLRYHRQKRKMIWNCEDVTPAPVVFDDNTKVDVKLLKAADYAGNEVATLPSWSWTMSYAADKDGPSIREIKSPTHPILIANTFEDGLGGWRNRGGAKGAAVTIDKTTAASGNCSVKLSNRSRGGAMSALIYDGNYSAEQYPIISFDYKLSSSVKLDFGVYMGGRWWDFGFTGGGRRTIGNISGVKADNQWHHASFNLGSALRRQQKSGALSVRYVIIYDRNNANNAQGAVAHFDNFIIGKVGAKAPVIRWKATDTTGIQGYSYSLDQDPLTTPDTELEGLAVAKQFGQLKPGVWYFHLRAQDGAGNWGPTATHPIMHAKP